MVLGGPNPGIWYVCEDVKNGKKCGTEVEVHIIGEPPDDIYLRHAGCSGTMRRKGAEPSASYPDQDCYSCINKMGCLAFARFDDGGPYPPECSEYELPPDCPECGKRMGYEDNDFWCESCEVAIRRV